LLLALALSSTTACAVGSGDDRGGEPRNTAAERTPGEIAIVALTHPPPVLERAVLVTTASCMAGSGFDYPPLEVFERSTPLPGSLGGFLPALTVASASAGGYGDRIGVDNRATNGDLATEAYLSELPSRDRRRYTAVKEAPSSRQVSVTLPTGTEITATGKGCVARGRRAVYGSVRGFLRLFYFPQQIRRAATSSLRAPRVREALDAYVECMAAAGHGVATPNDTEAVAQRRFAGTRSHGRPSADEVALAVADATCQEESRFFSILDAQILTEAAEWLVEEERALLALQELQEDSIRRAEEIVRNS
jgi:hypothetical protein